MRLDRILRTLAILAALCLIGTGCGGFSASQSISPASFLLPGLVGNESSGDSPDGLRESIPPGPVV
ncbi:MAG TPA: hypothetical protein VMS21_16505 [Methylomirabilota bacterium]|nr:hypothetical protein [Methylomirabilota bacterium]